MELRQVGSSGLQVSRLGLGTMTWGRDTSAEHARALLEMFCDAGGTLIDTAAAYGAGDAERVIGTLARAARPPRRDGHRDQGRLRDPAAASGSSTRHAARCCAISRDRCAGLKTDHVDLWQLHAWGRRRWRSRWRHRPGGVTGRARYAGISNFVGWQTAQAATWQRAFPGGRRSSARRSSTRCWPGGPRWRCCRRRGRSGWASSRGRRSAAGC